MSRTCSLSKKKSMVGNRVSHAKNRTKVRLLPNIQKKRLYSNQLKKYVTLKVSTQAIKSINKLGLDAYCNKMGVVLK